MIEGHSSVNGVMTIAVDASKLEEIETKLSQTIKLSWDVCDSFIGFLRPYGTEENKNAAAKNDTGRRGGIQKEASAQYNDNLRRETAEMVARKIRESFATRTRGGQAQTIQDQSLTQQQF